MASLSTGCLPETWASVVIGFPIRADCLVLQDGLSQVMLYGAVMYRWIHPHAHCLVCSSSSILAGVGVGPFHLQGLRLGSLCVWCVVTHCPALGRTVCCSRCWPWIELMVHLLAGFCAPVMDDGVQFWASVFLWVAHCPCCAMNLSGSPQVRVGRLRCGGPLDRFGLVGWSGPCGWIRLQVMDPQDVSCGG